VKNPLYSDLTPACQTTNTGCAGERDKSLVFVAGVVGVPWQDIAVDPTDLTKGYLTGQELADQNIWPKIIGDPKASPPVPPIDPHMEESIQPRGNGTVPPASGPYADPINGHEWDPSMAPSPNADLQYACIFPLDAPRTCTQILGCSCFVPPGADPAATHNPLCQNAAGQYSNIQTRAAAYPGIRQLQVLQGLGEQAIVASICPSNMSNSNATDFAYRPVVASLMNKIRPVLRGRCLPRQLAVASDGHVACSIYEVFTPPGNATCTCGDKPGRITPELASVPKEIWAYGSCACEMVQLTGADRTTCQTTFSPPATVPGGWCYVDPSQAGSNADAECAIVSRCPASQRRIIRYVNADSEPRPDSIAFLVCDGDAAPPSGTPTDPCP
jgi:hypothetical protein